MGCSNPSSCPGKRKAPLAFLCANLARYAGVDAEAVLRATNAKFERRFHYIEQGLKARGRTVHDSNLEEMDALWNEAKRHERGEGK